MTFSQILWRSMLVIYMCVSLNLSAYSQSSNEGYQALIKMYQEFLEFRRPEVIDGVPNYSQRKKAWIPSANDCWKSHRMNGRFQKKWIFYW